MLLWKNMGFKTFGFSGGRVDTWEPAKDIYWGKEQKMAGRQALFWRQRTRKNPFGSSAKWD